MRFKSFFILLSSFLLSFNSYARQKNESPYETNLVKDGIWITTFIFKIKIGRN